MQITITQLDSLDRQHLQSKISNAMPTNIAMIPAMIPPIPMTGKIAARMMAAMPTRMSKALMAIIIGSFRQISDHSTRKVEAHSTI